MRGVMVEFRGPSGWEPYEEATTTTTTTTTTAADAAPAYDDLGEDAETWGEPIDVDDVLVAAGPYRDSIESNRPDGVTIAYTLVVPRSFGYPLRGCQARVPGDPRWLDVVGDPRATPDGQLRRPSPVRNRIVEVGGRDG